MSNEYILRSFHLNGPYNTYLDKILAILEIIFASLTTIKSSFILFLQVNYLSISDHLIKLDHIDGLELSDASYISYVHLREVIDTLMKNLGSHTRHAGTTALFCQSVWVCAPIAFFLIDLINYKRVFKLLDDISFVCFLKDPQKAKKRLNDAMDLVLKQILESNLNYSQYILDEEYNRIKLEGENRIPFEKSFKMRTKTMDSSRSQDSLIFKTYLNNKWPSVATSKQSINRLFFKSVKESKNLASQKLSQNQQKGKIIEEAGSTKVSFQLNELTTQYAYIIRLIEDKTNIWPPNRDERWREISCTNWFYLYLAGICFMFTIMNVCTIIVIKIGIDSAKDGGDAMLKSYKYVGLQQSDKVELCLMERLTMFEQLLFVYFATHWFSMPLTLLVSCINDQAKHLYDLRRKIKLFIKKVDAFKEFEATRKSCRSFEDFECIAGNLVDLPEFEFDKDALKLYIRFQMFCNELSSTLKFARYILNQNVCFIICSVSPSLFYIRHIPVEHYRLFAIFYIGIMIILNGSLYICGSINASCVQVSKLVWSILASSMQPDLEIRNQKSTRKLVKKSKSILDNDKVEINRKFTEDLFMEHDKSRNTSDKLKLITDKFNHQLSSAVSSHTLLLWHKLAVNQELLLEKFQCRILSLLRLEHTSIMKFNFWLVSLVLIFLTVQR